MEIRKDRNGIQWAGKALAGMWCDGCKRLHRERLTMWFPKDAETPGINTEMFCSDTLGSSYYFGGQLKDGK